MLCTKVPLTTSTSSVLTAFDHGSGINPIYGPRYTLVKDFVEASTMIHSSATIYQERFNVFLSFSRQKEQLIFCHLVVLACSVAKSIFCIIATVNINGIHGKQ